MHSWKPERDPPSRCEGTTKLAIDAVLVFALTVIAPLRFLNENLIIIILCNRTDLEPEKLSLRVADFFVSSH